MGRFFVKASSISNRQARIAGAEYRHMRTVLRLRSGDQVLIFDDAGYEHEGTITSMNPSHALVSLGHSYRPERESPLTVSLAQAIPKGSRMNLVIEKVTELGVARVIPFTSSYTTVKNPGEVGAGKLERWRRLAVSAAKQSGRAVVPQVKGPVTWPEILTIAREIPLRLFLDPSAGAAGGGDFQTTTQLPTQAIVLVGPEGGFSQHEVAQAKQAGFQSVALGPRILRSETAGIVGVTICQLWWGDLSRWARDLPTA